MADITAAIHMNICHLVISAKCKSFQFISEVTGQKFQQSCLSKCTS